MENKWRKHRAAAVVDSYQGRQSYIYVRIFNANNHDSSFGLMTLESRFMSVDP